MTLLPVYLTSVVALGILAQLVAARLRLPSILLLLGFGFLLGRFSGVDVGERIGDELLLSVVSLSVAVILLEGGLTLRLAELRQSGRVVLQLVTIGAAVSWVLTALAARHLLGMDVRIATLIGALLVVTGPTVIGPLLRHVRPTRRVADVAKWEGIVIDPIGAVLTVLVFEALLVHSGPSPVLNAALFGLAKTIVVGVAVAAGTAVALVQLLRRFWIPDFLHSAVFLAATLVAFTGSNLIQGESGLFTVTLLGVILANQKTVVLRHVVEFKENLRVLLISCLFIVLASRIELQQITGLGLGGGAFLLALIVVIRPVATFCATLATDLNWRERLFLSMLAPRGIVAAAVSAVFALEIAHRYHKGALPDGAEQLVPVTFLVIVGTVAFYGLLAAPLARWLKLADANPQGILFAGAEPWVVQIAEAVQQAGYPVLLVDTNWRNISAARMKGLPTVCASVLSEYVHEEVDLQGIGRMLAVTPNEEVNALAVQEMAHLFGRAEVYQLSPWETSGGRRESVGKRLQGRILFAADATHGRLVSMLAAGATVKRTRLTDEFTYDDFLARYGPTALPLMTIEPSESLLIRTTESTTSPQPGQTVIALVDEPGEDNS